MSAQFYFRWVIVVAAAAAMLALAMGQLVNGLSVFFVPLEREIGWPRGSVTLINTASLFGLALGGVVTGALADQAPNRSVCLAGALAVGLCVTLAAGADRLWQFYLLFFLAGSFGAGLFALIIAVVGGWILDATRLVAEQAADRLFLQLTERHDGAR